MPRAHFQCVGVLQKVGVQRDRHRPCPNLTLPSPSPGFAAQAMLSESLHYDYSEEALVAITATERQRQPQSICIDTTHSASTVGEMRRTALACLVRFTPY